MYIFTMEVTVDNMQHTLTVLKMVFTHSCSIHTFLAVFQQPGDAMLEVERMLIQISIVIS